MDVWQKHLFSFIDLRHYAGMQSDPTGSWWPRPPESQKDESPRFCANCSSDLLFKDAIATPKVHLVLQPSSFKLTEMRAMIEFFNKPLYLFLSEDVTGIAIMQLSSAFPGSLSSIGIRQGGHKG